MCSSSLLLHEFHLSTEVSPVFFMSTFSSVNDVTSHTFAFPSLRRSQISDENWIIDDVLAAGLCYTNTHFAVSRLECLFAISLVCYFYRTHNLNCQFSDKSTLPDAHAVSCFSHHVALCWHASFVTSHARAQCPCGPLLFISHDRPHPFSRCLHCFHVVLEPEEGDRDKEPAAGSEDKDD